MIKNNYWHVICVIFLEMEELAKAKYLLAPLPNNVRQPS